MDVCPLHDDKTTIGVSYGFGSNYTRIFQRFSNQIIFVIVMTVLKMK